MGSKKSSTHPFFHGLLPAGKNQENLKLSEKKKLLKKIVDILAEEKWITSAELLVLKEKIEKYGGNFMTRAVIYCRCSTEEECQKGCA